MRAVVISGPGGPEVLEVREVPEPLVGPDDLLVRVRGAGVNRADVLQRRGGYPQPGKKPEFEVPGLEVAGEVERVGERVTEFAPGDRVMALMAGGGYAEYASVPARVAVGVPDAMSWEEAGGTPEVFITAHDALLQCDLVAGERVLIHAVGSGVGTAAVQIAKMMGASTVIGTAGSAEKIERAKEIGLDIGVNYHEQGFVEAVGGAVGGADVILDVIGASYFDQNMRALATKGRMVIVGMMGGSVTEANLAPLMAKRAQIRGTGLRSRSLEEKALATRAFEKSVVPHLASGRIKVVVDQAFGLDGAADAHRRMEANENFGKLVLLP